MTTDTLVLTIVKEAGPILGRYRLVSVRAPTLWERLRGRFKKAEADLPRYPSGLSVGIRMTSAQYATIMGMTNAPDPNCGFAAAALIPTNESEAVAHDQGMLV